MNAQETTEIRGLTVDELDEVSGGKDAVDAAIQRAMGAAANLGVLITFTIFWDIARAEAGTLSAAEEASIEME